jgi:hypothetical protein
MMDSVPLENCTHEPKIARGLCRPCYYTNWRRGFLPPIQRTPQSSEEHRQQMRDWKAKNLTPARRKGYVLMELYEITLADFERMKAAQAGACALCGQVPPPSKDGKEVLFVDHDHETGQVRALLCRRCNLAVGWVEKCDIAKIQTYLESFKQRSLAAVNE